MAKSIGTLKAMLVLDSKGFIKGFEVALNATKKGVRDIGRDAGDRAARSWLKWSLAIRAVRRAINALTKEIMTFREVSPIVNAAVESFFDIGRALRDSVLHPLLEAVAPAFTFVFESALDAVNRFGSFLDEIGVKFEDIAIAALAVGGIIGNAFKLIESGAESAIALLTELQLSMMMPTDSLRAAKLSARQRGIESQGKWLEAIEAIGKILGGDLSGIVPRNPRRAFVPKELKHPGSHNDRDDLGMPFLERGTSEAMKLIMGIQRPDSADDKLGEAVEHLKAIEGHVRPKRGEGDALHIGRLGGR